MTAGFITRTLMDAGFMVESASDVIAAFESVKILDPDCILVDVSLGAGPTGVDFAYVIAQERPDIAFWQIPITGAGVVSALIVGRLMTKKLTNRGAILVGSLITVAGLIALALASGQKSFIAFLPGTLLAGAGVVVVSIPFGNLIIKEAPPAQYGPVTSSRTTIGQFFYSIGLALATVMVNRMTVGGVTEKLSDAGVQSDQIGTAVTAINQFVRTGDDPTTQLGKEALADAATSYGGAFSTIMLVTAALIFVAALAATVLLRKTETTPATETPTDQTPTAPQTEKG